MNFKYINLVLFQFHIVSITQADLKFTNLKCLEFDKPFASIPICRLKIVQRGITAMDLNVKLHKIPVNNVSVSMVLLKYSNS